MASRPLAWGARFGVFAGRAPGWGLRGDGRAEPLSWGRPGMASKCAGGERDLGQDEEGEGSKGAATGTGDVWCRAGLQSSALWQDTRRKAPFLPAPTSPASLSHPAVFQVPAGLVSPSFMKYLQI